MVKRVNEQAKKKAARQIAEIAYSYLAQLPEAEQERRIERIEKIKIRSRRPTG
jgi:hypothetical protein